MHQFPETELILTPENRVYHINLLAEDIADDVIVVGDQNRVAEISSFFSKIEFKTAHREFVTHTGMFNNRRFTVLSTGIGTDNVDIVMNELDAAVNIDPATRSLNSRHRSLNIIRLGTSGSLQGDVAVDALVASTHGLGLDGLLNFYQDWKSINEDEISEAFIGHTGWTENLPYPYCVKGSDELLKRFAGVAVTGITATAPGFYGPQGRQIRLKAASPRLNELLGSFSCGGHRITNFEMETSALYGLGKLLNHRCMTLCVIIANRVRKEFTRDYSKSTRKLIETALNQLSN